MGRRKRLRTTSTVDDHLEAQSHQQHSQGEDQTVDHESTITLWLNNKFLKNKKVFSQTLIQFCLKLNLIGIFLSICVQAFVFPFDC